MTELDKLIAAQPDGMIISVGSASGFFFIGTKAEWEQDEDELSDYLLQGFVRTARKAQRELKRRYKAACKAAEAGEAPDNKLYTSLAAILDTYLRYTASAARFVPLRQRSITASYGGIEAGTLKIIVPGDEYGDYWLRDEYVRARAKL